MISFVIESLDDETDKQIITDIYEQYAPWMRSRAYTLTGDYEVSYDLAHDCIISLIKHIDTIRNLNDRQLRSYIATTVNHTAINYMKHSSRTCLVTENEECFFDEIPGRENVEEAVEKKLNIETVRENMNGLSSRDRELIILKYNHELSDAEISEIIGIKENSVRMTVRRSVERLGKKVERGAKK